MPSSLPENLRVAEIMDGRTIRARIVPDKSQFARARGRIAPYKALPTMMRPVLEKIGDYVRTTMIDRTFDKEGPGWRPLAYRTVRERIAQGYGGHHPILQRSGDLYDELTEKSHPKHIEIIRVGKNARIEIGGSSEKFLRNQIGDKTARLPARPMIPGTGRLPIADRDRMAINNIIKKEIQNQVNRRSR